jgi:hypothetical protein
MCRKVIGPPWNGIPRAVHHYLDLSMIARVKGIVKEISPEFTEEFAGGAI